MVGLSDTHPDAERVWLKLLREATPARRLLIMQDLNRMAYQLALDGLRRRHPGASEEEIRWRMAALLLGEDLATRAYGPPPEGISGA